jgi:hypothetical protein
VQHYPCQPAKETCLHLLLPSSTLLGFFDFVTSWIWSCFFLAAFSALVGGIVAAVSAFIGEEALGSYNAAVAMCFLLFLAYVATAVLALLDIRDGKGPKWATSASAAGESVLNKGADSDS